jgi:hypothetical protein
VAPTGSAWKGSSRSQTSSSPHRPTWPLVFVELEQGAVGGRREHLGEDGATITFQDAVAEIRRTPPRVTFTFAGEPALDGVVHPYLSPAAGLLAHWHGHECLHAGAFVHGGTAWGLVAGRGGGKSTTLARLALDGVPVVSDDLLVLGDGTVFAGPRAIDLRGEPARRLGVGEPLGVLGTRARWRLRLPAVEASVRLGGWVFLEWGASLSAIPVSAGPRLERLARERMIRRRPTEPLALLRLASLPAVEVRRPRSWGSLRETVRLLLDSLPV